ncbi:hypothetical protein BDZ94DRAFT_151212 [Collybia nuda]|uniref:Uncharacterized protein n=1 Tax=Collybia nuda TaxID=64659 RepID=A0A9P5XW17_9AGAR|nr:hypothetical protein BDZ94DRAFT_151212 [Collybia nuda]
MSPYNVVMTTHYFKARACLKKSVTSCYILTRRSCRVKEGTRSRLKELHSTTFKWNDLIYNPGLNWDISRSGARALKLNIYQNDIHSFSSFSLSSIDCGVIFVNDRAFGGRSKREYFLKDFCVSLRMMRIDDLSRFQRSNFPPKTPQAEIRSQDQCIETLPTQYPTDTREGYGARSNCSLIKRKRNYYEDTPTPVTTDAPSISLPVQIPPSRPLVGWRPLGHTKKSKASHALIIQFSLPMPIKDESTFHYPFR